MSQFKFTCPQCHHEVMADESMCGSVAECPFCEKGIVVPMVNKTQGVVEKGDERNLIHNSIYHQAVVKRPPKPQLQFDGTEGNEENVPSNGLFTTGIKKAFTKWQQLRNPCGCLFLVVLLIGGIICSLDSDEENDAIVPPAKVGTHEKVQLWEDGPFWAKTNVGANEPWESGYFFWWGDPVGYKRKGKVWVASDGSWSKYSFDLAPTFAQSIAFLKKERWITVDNVLVPEHDAAHIHWGGDWRMPTKQELEELRARCVWTWLTMNGVNGYLISGRGDYASASIFLPCAGYGMGGWIYRVGSMGFYWSSVPHSDLDNAWLLVFGSRGKGLEHFERCLGHSVRAVQDSSTSE